MVQDIEGLGPKLQLQLVFDWEVAMDCEIPLSGTKPSKSISP
jgi:hypothetical protein